MYNLKWFLQLRFVVVFHAPSDASRVLLEYLTVLVHAIAKPLSSWNSADFNLAVLSSKANSAAFLL